MSDVDQMIKMANQIADNFSYHDDQAARTADHIERFWAQRMRRRISEHLHAGGEGLSDPAKDALRLLEG